MAYINGNKILFSASVSGTSDGAGVAIIDVQFLPTTSINENAFYRTPDGIFYYTNGKWHKVLDTESLIPRLMASRRFYDDNIGEINFSSESSDRVGLTYGEAILQKEGAHTLDEMIGATVTYISGSISNTITIATTNVVDISADGYTIAPEGTGNKVCIFVAFNDSYWPSKYAQNAFPKAGIYFSDYNDGDPYRVTQLSKSGNLKKIDKKFLDGSTSGGYFEGTAAEYNEVADTVPVGAIIWLTDEEGNLTTAVLDKAILGQMILGTS